MSHIVLIASNRDLVSHIARALPDAGHDATVLETSSPRSAASMLSKADLIIAAAADGGAAEFYETLGSIPELRDVPMLMMIGEENIAKVCRRSPPDDFVIQPAGAAEVVARLQRIFSARAAARTREYPLKAGDVALDPKRFDARVRGRSVALTLQEYRLLQVLIRNTGRTFSRADLLKKAWPGVADIEGSRTVDVHVRRLRAKLAESETTAIRTASGVGYRLEVNTDLTNA